MKNVVGTIRSRSLLLALAALAVASGALAEGGPPLAVTAGTLVPAAPTLRVATDSLKGAPPSDLAAKLKKSQQDGAKQDDTQNNSQDDIHTYLLRNPLVRV